MSDDIERVEGEVEEPVKKKKGRPPKTDKEKRERAMELRDADDARIADFARNRGGNQYAEKTQAVIGGVVRSVFFDERTGQSHWKGDDGKLRALPKYETAEELVEAIVRWENFCMAKVEAGDNIIPDAEFLATGLGVSLATMRNWRRGSRGDAFRDIIENELNKIASIKNQLAMEGGIPPIVWATMMNNVHGYTQNSKVEIDVATRQLPSKEELLKKVSLLP